MRKRLDVVLVERGVVETRAKAQAFVLAGRVRGFEKPGTPVDPDVAIELVDVPRYVSRGGEKLAHGLATFGMDVTGVDALDVGASTGGFVDCLLQHGASRVVALDVGYGQLDFRLRHDPRVTVLERMNVRELTPQLLPFRPQLVTCDVSFIGLGKALPPALACAAPGWQAIVLVKPQFEAGPRDVGRGGVVRDEAVHERVLAEVRGAAHEWGAEVRGETESPIRGAKGNREFLLHLVAVRDAGHA